MINQKDFDIYLDNLVALLLPVILYFEKYLNSPHASVRGPALHVAAPRPREGLEEEPPDCRHVRHLRHRDVLSVPGDAYYIPTVQHLSTFPLCSLAGSPSSSGASSSRCCSQPSTPSSTSRGRWEWARPCLVFNYFTSPTYLRLWL